MKKTRWIIALVALVATLVGMTLIFTMGAAANETETELRIAYCNLSYKDNIYIKYAVKAENAENVKILIWTEPRTEYVFGTQDKILNQIYTENINGEDHLIFDYKELTAKQMADVVYARAYTEKDGIVYYSEVNKYSILQYAYNKLGKTGVATDDAKLKTLLENMLVYGASAQEYFEYHVERLVTKDYYQVKVNGGWLNDLCDHGLYLPGDQVQLNAPETDANGGTFSYWEDKLGNKVTLNDNNELTVGRGNNVYTPVYVKYSTGLEFDSNGDGTCYIVGMGDCNDAELVIPPVSPDGDQVIGIDSSAFAGEAITKVYFPNTIEEIARRAFNNCDSLTDVFYDGTEEEWNEIDISSGNDAIENANMHFRTPVVETFTVSFVDFDGTVLKTETVEIGKSATAPETPVREGFVFTGWDNDFSAVTEDLTVTALYERSVNGPSIIVSDVIANVSDETVNVIISIANNPGISSLKFDFAYGDGLTLKSVAFDASFGAYVTTPEPFENPQVITFISPLADVTVNGTFATLTFAISDEITVDTVANITLTLHNEEIFNADWMPVTFDVINGSVEIQVD